MRPLLLLLLSFGCRHDKAAPDAPICQRSWDSVEGVEAWRMVYIDDPALGEGGPLAVQIAVPLLEGRYADGAPAVVHLPGTWETDQAPLTQTSVRLRPGQGVVAVYPNLPGGRGPYSSGGVDDRRGPLARQAVGVALRYAAGQLVDIEGCSLDDRAGIGINGAVALSAMSNGGNLAWTTLGDTAVALPDEVVGVVTFESPMSGQLAAVDQGPAAPSSPVYQRGACGLSPRNALTCDWQYAGIAYAPTEEGGEVFIDADGDGALSAGEARLGAVRVPGSEAWAQSLEATLALEAAGVEAPDRLPPDKAGAFWLDREGPPSMPAAAARLPALAGMVVGTETDHVATGLLDHEHLTGAMAAMQAAGLSWTRLQPDAAYVRELSKADDAFVDVDANTPFLPTDRDPPLEPDEDSDHPVGVYLTAGVIELFDRWEAGNWSPNLDAVLHNPEK